MVSYLARSDRRVRTGQSQRRRHRHCDRGRAPSWRVTPGLDLTAYLQAHFAGMRQATFIVMKDGRMAANSTAPLQRRHPPAGGGAAAGRAARGRRRAGAPPARWSARRSRSAASCRGWSCCRRRRHAASSADVGRLLSLPGTLVLLAATAHRRHRDLRARAAPPAGTRRGRRAVRRRRARRARARKAAATRSHAWPAPSTGWPTSSRPAPTRCRPAIGCGGRCWPTCPTSCARR